MELLHVPHEAGDDAMQDVLQVVHHAWSGGSVACGDMPCAAVPCLLLMLLPTFLV
jgi:hypothetical protein